ncbi:MAG TPA: DUF2069 domain-containing protein [Burkholderiales bacterium]|nr:DUF2069 domain-containing protein [Burkholderiales bacterium]
MTRVVASVSLIALFILCLAWETVLAPLRPGGSYIALKALPLLLPLPGILSGKLYTYRWSSMLILAYLGEGAMRAFSERGASQVFAALEIVLSAVFFAAVVSYVRQKRASV